MKRCKLSEPHVANSLIHNSNFSVNRRRRIGGVAITNNSWIPHGNPHLQLNFMLTCCFTFLLIKSDFSYPKYQSHKYFHLLK